MIKKQVFFVFKKISALKSSKTRQELFGFFFDNSNHLRGTPVGTEFLALEDRVPGRKKLSGNSGLVFASKKRNRLFLNFLPKLSSFKVAGFRNGYAIKTGTASLCKSCFLKKSFGQKSQKNWKSNQHASLTSYAGSGWRPVSFARQVHEVVLMANYLKNGKRKKIWKIQSQRSGEILKEPFIDNFLTKIDQIAFGLTKKIQKCQPSTGLMSVQYQESTGSMSILRSENRLFSQKQSLNAALQTGLPAESTISYTSLNLNKVSARGATPIGRIVSKFILGSWPLKIRLTEKEFLARETSKQKKQVAVDVNIRNTNSNKLKKSLDTKVLSVQARKNITCRNVVPRPKTLPTSRKRNLTILPNRDLLIPAEPGTQVTLVSRLAGKASAYTAQNTVQPVGARTASFTRRTCVPGYAGRSAEPERSSLPALQVKPVKATLQELPLKVASQKNSKKLHLFVKLGDYVNCGDQIGESCGTPLIVSGSGKIIKISKKQILLQKTQPVLYYSQANVHVKKDEWVTQGAPILTLTHQTLVTGDIVQGIPRIEQLFEAPNSPPPGMRGGHNLHQTLHTQIREIFRKNWTQAPLPTAVRQSLQQIQEILVESIQKVYLSQGVLIADKHVEIIVRQMSSKAEVLDGGNTGLLLEELLPVEQIENTNLATPGKKALYAPAVVGLTRSALESDSFISAASFQETTRVLSRDAIIGKSDFLHGLKEKVVIGDLISAGTGLDIYFVYTLLANTLAT